MIQVSRCIDRGRGGPEEGRVGGSNFILGFRSIQILSIIWCLTPDTLELAHLNIFELNSFVHQNSQNFDSQITQIHLKS